MAIKTASERLASHLLGASLADFVAARRPDRSWRLIARDLFDATKGEIDLSPEALRKRYSAEPEAVAS